MITIILRILQYGFKNFRRNGWLSTVTIIIMSLALLVFLGLILFRVATKAAIDSIQDKIDISVYFKSTTPEDQILSIKASLEALPEVKSVSYVSADQALEIFKNRHRDDEIVSQAINELNVNPLLASINIKAHRSDDYAKIDQYLNSADLSQFIESISYARNQIIIDKLTVIIHNIERSGFILTIILAILSGLVVLNTIRLAIYSNREEINIMRLVGASNSLVRGPYMVEGLLTSGVAAAISIILALPVIYLVSPYLKVFISNLDLWQYFISHLVSLFFYQLLFGAFVGVVSSFIAVRRYLKN